MCVVHVACARQVNASRLRDPEDQLELRKAGEGEELCRVTAG